MSTIMHLQYCNTACHSLKEHLVTHKLFQKIYLKAKSADRQVKTNKVTPAQELETIAIHTQQLYYYDCNHHDHHHHDCISYIMANTPETWFLHNLSREPARLPACTRYIKVQTTHSLSLNKCYNYKRLTGTRQ